MKAIFICIFSIFFSQPILTDNRTEKKKMQEEIQYLLKRKEYSKVILPIQNYVFHYPYEITYKALLAQAFLYNENLDTPLATDEIFIRNQKIQKIKENYKKSAEMYESFIKEMEPKNPNSVELGTYYFEWALAEILSGKKERSIRLFEKAYKLNPNLIESNYNIFYLKESKGESKEGSRYLKKFMDQTK
jgi:tetratricopeptide (TPR) repeat protein